MRDRLIKLLQEFADGTYSSNGYIVDNTQVDDVADHLLANGVIVPPCKVGDTLYVMDVDYDSCQDCEDFCPAYEIGDCCECDKNYPVFPSVEQYLQKKCCPKHTLDIIEHKFAISSYGWVTKELNKTVFFTREEAEKALKERDRK